MSKLTKVPSQSRRSSGRRAAALDAGGRGEPARGPAPATAAPATSLQRARRLGHSVVQTKLTLGPADDPYERQADATAKSVMQWLSSPQTGDAGADAGGGGAEGSAQRQAVQRDDLEEDPDQLALKRAETVQREFVQRENFEEEDPDQLSFKRIEGGIGSGAVGSGAVQRDDLEEDPDMLSMKRADSAVRRRFLQRDSLRRDAVSHGPEGGAVDSSVEQTIDGARSGGSGLEDSVRAPMEQAFGADFSGVKIHDDSRSHELNRSLSARSFATGNHIFMGEGEYSPGSSGGQELIAHELTHVVQQGAAQAKRSDES